jgi:hypothetical protein
MVATLGVGFERHGGHPGSGWAATDFYPIQPGAEHPIRAPTPAALQVHNNGARFRALPPSPTHFDPVTDHS